MKAPGGVVLVLAALAGCCSAQLFAEQVEQQQLNLQTQSIQQRLQDMQRLMQFAPDELQKANLARQQSDLLQQLQDVQQRQLQLQAQLQDQVARGQQPTAQVQELENRLDSQPQPFVQPQPQPRPQPRPQRRPQPRPQPQPQPQPQPVLVRQGQPTPPPPPPQQQQQEPDITFPGREEESSVPCSTLSGRAGTCRLLVKCVTFFAQIPELRKQPCALDSQGNQGVCCPANERRPPSSKGNNGVLQPPPPPPVEVPPLTPQQLSSAAAQGVQRVRERQELEQQLVNLNRVLQPDSAARRHLELFPTSNNTLNSGKQAQSSVEASLDLLNEFQLSKDQGTFALPRFSVLNTVIADLCPRRLPCRVGKYRTADATCNNIVNSRWGSQGSALQRLLPPKYGDGVNSPRVMANGSPLPSARLVSSRLAQESDRPSDNVTLLLMQWGQFLDHDLTHTPISRGQNGVGISCCQDGQVSDPRVSHPDCFPIPVPRDDRFLAPFGERCMEFVRSLPAPRPECNFGPREQMNQITGFLDGSNIYGSDANKQQQLRLFRGGRLREQNVRGRSMLPANPNECQDTNGAACFVSGDGRVNEQPDLALMHTVWLREHNRVADQLQALHPQWTDEELFQEARRIVVAEMQHITYNEFLPIVLGKPYMDRAEMSPKDSGYTALYDRELNPGITNAFATAAFRFGHTLLVSNLQGVGRFGNVRKNFPLSKSAFKPFMLYEEDGIDDMVRGLTTQSSQKFDRFFTKEVTNHLFQNDLPFGLDLVALNLQRGRDHGLPGYTEWRQVCGLRRPRSWEDLQGIMDPDGIAVLQSMYPSVDEVDLFAAGVSERPAPGALLGPTFTCIVGDQFGRLRRGDRFFYEEGNQPSSFKPEQLQQLRRTSLARVLCDNTDNIALMQPLAFFHASFVNQRVACNSDAIPRLDIRAWANERPSNF
ncbi:Chorion peroxidase [Frankliniella fusca]|uniref:Chorion peroxidase n=1 Tax=Frankliniella fusca TaxID=407009 RepID=A0AAE1LFZ9_9NEOP|nr:Chorion peroxidase [Frankliniella fusca]